MNRQPQVVLLVLCLTVSCCVGKVGSHCYQFKDCESCLSHTHYYMRNCNWCPESQTCHVRGSWLNPCWAEDQIMDPGQCSPRPQSKPYDHRLAAELAAWSSLAYINPNKISRDTMQHLISSKIGRDFRMLKFIQTECNMWFEYSACSLLVAVSELDRQIVVSFEGTQQQDQLYEQFFIAALTGLMETSVGGEVLYYNLRVHELLYPCLKEFLIHLLHSYGDFDVILTGHSLGGSQAQLVAAYLVHEQIVDSSSISVYTFGSPRFSDLKFAIQFDKLVPTNWRLVQAYDPIPLIPNTFFFYHTHGEVWFSEPEIDLDSEYTLCHGNEDADCADSQVALCLSAACVEIHLNYFVKSIGTSFGYEDIERKRGYTEPVPTSNIGTCTVFDFDL